MRESCLARRLWLLGLSATLVPLTSVSCLAVALAATCFSARAAAFDPTTVASGLGSVAGIMGGSGLDEAIDVGFALGDLLTDLDVEQTSTEEVDRAVKDLENLNSKIKDLRYSRGEVQSLINEDLSKAQSISAKLRAIRNMIQASKRIADIMGLRPKAGMVASTVQQMKINSMILDELQTIRRNMFLTSLKDRKAQIRRSYLLEQIVERESSRNAFRSEANRLSGLRDSETPSDLLR